MVTAYLALVDRRWRHFLAFAVLVGVCIIAAVKLNGFVREILTYGALEPQSHYPAVTSVLDRLLTWRGVSGVIGNLFGQSLYLVTATLGVIVFGVLTAFQQVRTADTHDYVWAFLLLSLAGTIALSALALNSTADAARLDHVYYGRYNEGVLAPFLVIGLLSATRKIRPWMFILLGVGVLAFVTYFFLMSHPKPTTGLLNMSSLYYMRYFESRFGTWHPGIMFVVFGVIVGGWLLLSRITSIRILPVAFAFFSFTAAAYAVDLLYIYSHARQMQTANITRAANENIDPGTCISYDSASQGFRKMWLYPYMLYRYPLQRVNLNEQKELCSQYLVSDRDDIPARFPQARVGIREDYGEETLWVLPAASKPGQER
jgi:MFS family permease